MTVIVNIYGLNHAMYGELVEFETGVKGIVQNVERKTRSLRSSWL